jgi:hypothetical protein
MKTRFQVLGTILSCLLLVSMAASQTPPPANYTFTAISYPDAVSTHVADRNDRGDITGSFRLNSEGQGLTRHCFTLIGGVFSRIDVPGAGVTRCLTINDRGDVAGFFSDSTGIHSFLLTGGAFTIFDFPGANFTFVQGMNVRGEIVGGYLDGTGAFHGFLRSSDGTLTSIDFPGAVNTIANGINVQGDITGNYDASDGTSHPFVLSNGTFTPVDVPPGFGVTRINARGEITGLFSDGLIQHGYVLIKDQLFTVDPPGSTFVGSISPNDRGELSGWFTGPDGDRGFVAKPNP